MPSDAAPDLAVPLFTVRYESLIGSFLGETAAKLATLFASVRERRCVLFFDEFDSIAQRRDGGSHARAGVPLPTLEVLTALCARKASVSRWCPPWVICTRDICS